MFSPSVLSICDGISKDDVSPFNSLMISYKRAGIFLYENNQFLIKLHSLKVLCELTFALFEMAKNVYMTMTQVFFQLKIVSKLNLEIDTG